MITFMDNQEKQIEELENQQMSTHNTFMDLADIFIARVKDKIVEESKPKKIEKVFELSTPVEPNIGQDKEIPFPKPYTINLSKFLKSTRKEEDSKVNKIFVGSVRITHSNFHKVRKKSFGFKPGVHHTLPKDTRTPDVSHKQTFFISIPGTSKTSTDHSLRHITPRDSNETFDPGGMHCDANY